MQFEVWFAVYTDVSRTFLYFAYIKPGWHLAKLSGCVVIFHLSFCHLNMTQMNRLNSYSCDDLKSKSAGVWPSIIIHIWVSTFVFTYMLTLICIIHAKRSLDWHQNLIILRFLDNNDFVSMVPTCGLYRGRTIAFAYMIWLSKWDDSKPYSAYFWRTIRTTKALPAHVRGPPC
jgi:hypothetical protein